MRAPVGRSVWAPPRPAMEGGFVSFSATRDATSVPSSPDPRLIIPCILGSWPRHYPGCLRTPFAYRPPSPALAKALHTNFARPCKIGSQNQIDRGVVRAASPCTLQPLRASPPPQSLRIATARAAIGHAWKPKGRQGGGVGRGARWRQRFELSHSAEDSCETCAASCCPT